MARETTARATRLGEWLEDLIGGIAPPPAPVPVRTGPSAPPLRR